MASSSSETTSDGPVLNVINKRLRALRKKLNRITQMEESLAQGKTLNKEQEETFRSKAVVLAGIDELEKLREPILQAVGQEIELALEKTQQSPVAVASEIQNGEAAAETETKGGDDCDSVVSDLLTLLYFGGVFDVSTLMRAHDNMLTRTHERNCCLTYDYVTDDDTAGEPLKERDLDLIAMLGSMLVSRPINSSLSHKNALQKCVEHAKLWLANAEHPVESNSNLTYADLREKLNKIMASEYFTTAPEIKAPVEVAAAAGNFTSFHVPMHGSVIPAINEGASVEGSAEGYQNEEAQSPSSHSNEVYDDESGQIEELHQGCKEIENPSEIQALETPDTQADQNTRDMDLKEQHTHWKPYQNYRGGRGGGRRGYSNGRGGRGGRGGYQNGRNQYYDQPGGYHPRNNYYRGRGGRGMGGGYNQYFPSGHNDHVQAAS
ncbi:uncharacterized protein LOC127260730 [Andrographis paniculata]|uniref:uncharacterized protein LOC127260730 n=1 Tax=Andrographis paniculata TaxID=175694 RepID=UPI0021E991CC|nr:uncharacterized protein LOC127260730 [Andrographis paniculata]